MKKFLPHIIMGIILIISIVGILLMTQQKTASTKKDPKLDKVALPQLTTKIAKNESKLIMKTTYGDITIKLFNKYTPLAVENFITHAKDGYYNNTSFHRVINNFMIQGGDPTGTGSGGQSIWKGKDKNIDSGNGFKNEISTSLYNIRGLFQWQMQVQTLMLVSSSLSKTQKMFQVASTPIFTRQNCQCL